MRHYYRKYKKCLQLSNNKNLMNNNSNKLKTLYNKHKITNYTKNLQKLQHKDRNFITSKIKLLTQICKNFHQKCLIY